MKYLHMTAFTLLVVGGLNWLLVGILEWGIGNLTDPISPLLTKAVYVLVGLSAIYLVITHKSSCRECAPSSVGGGGAGPSAGMGNM